MNGFITVRYMICSSGNQKTTSSPVSGVSGVPDGVGAQEGQLAAVLCHAADLVHLQAVAQLGDRVVLITQSSWFKLLPVVFVFLLVYYLRKHLSFWKSE